MGYCGKLVLQQKLGSSYIVNLKNVCEESSSEAATRNPTKNLACRNREQQNDFERNQRHGNLTTCEARQLLGLLFDATSLAVLHDRPKFPSNMLVLQVDHTLEIKYRDKSIDDILAMTVDVAFRFFDVQSNLRRSLKPGL